MTGYHILLPPGWAQIPLRRGTEEAIAAIVARMGADYTEPDAEARREFATEQLRAAAAGARQRNGVHLYLPVERYHGFVVAASFLVAEVAFGSLDSPESILVLNRLAAEPEAREVVVAGAFATRSESICPADPNRGIPLTYRSVDYVLPLPHDPDRWVVASLSAVIPPDGAEDPSPLWVELFDAVMATFRWTEEALVGE